MQYIGRLDRALLRERALGAIRRAIVTGELAPGTPVKDMELASRLGLSRTPVREALATLVDEGLIETKPHSYTRVTPLDARAVRDALEVVQTLHALATRLAVPILTAEHADEMRAANLKFAAAVDSGALDEAMTYDDAFHDVLVRASGNGAIAATIRRYTPLLHRGERMYFGSPSGRDSAPMHERIIAACEAGEVDRAAALAEENWANLATILEEQP
ncbi:GntR family transcriptional regulator [Actinocrispum wychmicini]|uniref:DNA-binding GntR family transcriptional regulator n=1 Tax=Actinocrispum wychmicini TaxID=1213861 RepID=A0A4R2IRR0_9PSEU|nr:GntR family transcriptional regulator [Actinocrispum wychmicini]TCO48131.1 DNA-binding GntR family transcriptional regulator [Actinocrispum wychmicini]